MTRNQFLDMIALVESGATVKSVGDNGLAGGAYQMHWKWRQDYWPAWMWDALAVLDRRALEYFIVAVPSGLTRPPATARALADLYNAGHQAPNPTYDARCLKALAHMGLSAETLDTIVE
jgi:hypothetical protein